MDIVFAILDQLDSTREQVLVAIEQLPDEALLAENAIGNYSIADILALQVAWEAELVTGLMRIDQGKKPEKLLAALAQPEAYDSRRYAEYRGRDLDIIFDDLQQVRMQLETWLEQFSERDLMNRKRYKWFGGESLKQVITAVTAERETAYVADMNRFARQWLEAQDAEPAHYIPLTAVSSEDENDEQPN
jgi:hypothetical protein